VRIEDVSIDDDPVELRRVADLWAKSISRSRLR